MTSARRAADLISLARAWASSCNGEDAATGHGQSCSKSSGTRGFRPNTWSAKHRLHTLLCFGAEPVQELYLRSPQTSVHFFNFTQLIVGLGGNLQNPDPWLFQWRNHAFGHVGSGWVHQDFNWRTCRAEPTLSQEFSQNTGCFNFQHDSIIGGIVNYVQTFHPLICLPTRQQLNIKTNTVIEI